MRNYINMENVAVVIRTKLRGQACQVPAEGRSYPIFVKGPQQAMLQSPNHQAH